jgi:hypothetical protein
MEEHDKNELRLSAEQAAEIRRRLADPNRGTIPAEEVFERFRKHPAEGGAAGKD